MAWPGWIDELRDRYLGDEASVFLLHGAIDEGRWVVEGQTIDCMTTLVQFLSRSREILGVMDPRHGLTFPGIGDRSRFQNLVAARRTLDGDLTPLREDHPQQCLALLYKALTTAGPPQGYLVIYAERLFPARTYPLEKLPVGVPPFNTWPGDATIRGSNNLVVLLTEDLEKIHPDVRAAIGRGLIEVPDEHPPVAVTNEVTEDVDLGGLTPAAELPEDGGDEDTPINLALPPFDEAARAEAPGTTHHIEDLADEPTPVAADVPEAPPPVPAGAPPAAPADPLLHALEGALRRYPHPPWPGLLPVREALAEVIHAWDPGRCGPLNFALDGDDNVIAEGPGAEWFQGWFDGGIVVRAASEQLLANLVEALQGTPVPDGTPIPIDEARLRTLRKQLDKLFS